MNDFITLSPYYKSIFKVPARLANHYSLKFETLGTGSYGTVLKFKSKTQPDIAIKLFVKVFNSLDSARNALRELNLLNNTNHANVVKILGAYAIENSTGELEFIYHITAYCGQNLRRVIEKARDGKGGGSRYSMKQLKSMMSDLLRACKYLNSAGIIHRDVKPENMCIDENWKLTLLDFGFARVIDRNNQMTEERGTHPYMSIEMIQEWRGVYDEKVDVWSIGAILCELLTGETFFTAENVKHPLDAAIQKLGPVPNSVLDQISDRTVCIHFKKHSERAERINFSDYLNHNGLFWLQDSIRENEKDLHDFIDYALQFEPALRMSVDFALAHNLLREVRDLPGEVVYEGSIPEEEPLPDGDEGMKECKRRIRSEINAAPRFME